MVDSDSFRHEPMTPKYREAIETAASKVIALVQLEVNGLEIDGYLAFSTLDEGNEFLKAMGREAIGFGSAYLTPESGTPYTRYRGDTTYDAKSRVHLLIENIAAQKGIPMQTIQHRTTSSNEPPEIAWERVYKALDKLSARYLRTQGEATERIIRERQDNDQGQLSR